MAIETEEQDDSIRGLLEKAASGDIQAEAPAPVDLTAEPTEPPQPPEPRTDRGDGRDATGKFVGKPAVESQPRETLTLKPKEPAQADPKAAKPADPQDVPPPLEWKGEAKVNWTRLPAPIRATLRETYETLQKAQAEVAPIKELIDLEREFLVREAGSVPEAFRQMTQFARMSVDKPVELALHILQRRGIDPRTVFGGQPVQQNGTQPQAPDIRSYVAQAVQQALQPIQAQVQQREEQQHISTIDAFAADPAHPYFNDVRVQMGALMKSGQAVTLQDAYDQATWANPSIRQALLAQQAGDAANAKAREVEAARKAALLSPSGAPVHGSNSVIGDSDGSIRGDLMAAFRAQQGAV